MKHNYSVMDERRIRKILASASQKCAMCRRPVDAHPCESSDHGWASILMALDDSLDQRISSGCAYPTETQARCVTPGARRHPFDGDRPNNSGWCVDPKCACDCHANEPITTEDLEEL